MAQIANPNQDAIDALQALLEEIDDEKNPSAKQLQNWLSIKDGLVRSRGQHHAKRNVSRGQIRSDVVSAIFSYGGTAQ